MATYDTLQVDISTPNDGQGDPLRTAFDKINQRFQALRIFLNNRGDWMPSTVYTASPNRDWVIVEGVGYLATENHTSGATFAADLAAGKWVDADSLTAIQAVDDLRADLASTAEGKGADLVAHGNSTVGSKLNLFDFFNAPRPKPYELIAHRGFRLLSPENTMSAFTTAYGMGATSLECDVQISSDGIPVIIHDSTVDRTTDGTGNVKDLSFAALRALDAGTHFNSRFASTKIPSFDEFVMFAKSRCAVIYPEIKGYRTQADIDLILGVISYHQAEQMTVLQSFNFSDLQYVRTRNKNIALGFLSSDISALNGVASLGGPTYLLLSYSAVLANPSWVATCRAAGVDVGVWTVNDAQEVTALRNIGVTKIMSDEWIGVLA